MLQIRDLCKQYTTGELTQTALDHVSLNLRDHEFVAVLGPSGSGKTTLLNMIGGLDRYDRGDLLLGGRSTRGYKARDWDTYRNHTIGFVFQNYNLIMHQSILANVELALTISGIPGNERKRRASEALERVGLGDQTHKKPHQLSGGQMQRVAIARALVNDPSILLADEPTGALDSETSLQVMELLKEVSRDRLVIMVTHNGELAEQYATRIVQIKDGKIQSDTHPYFPGQERSPEAVLLPGQERAAETDRNGRRVPGRRKKHASMSFLTALALSFNNLRTKKGRTILVSIAGSIGIIGIALILALSNGVNAYIGDIEEGTVLQYPVTLSKSSINYSSYISSFMGQDQVDQGRENRVTENPIVRRFAGGLGSNDLKSFKAYIDSGASGLESYARAIEYTYDVTPQIYRGSGSKIRRVLPEQAISSLDSIGVSAMEISMVNLLAFYELPQNSSLYSSQYELKAGRWPKNKNECVVVLAQDGSITDTALYALGLKNAGELDEIIHEIAVGKNVVQKKENKTYTYQDFMGITFRAASASDGYVYDKKNRIWTDRSDSMKQRRRILKHGQTIRIAGVAQLKSGSRDALLNTGIYYTHDLTQWCRRRAAGSKVVAAQKKTPKINIFTGKPFGAEKQKDKPEIRHLFRIDMDTFKKAFSLNTSRLNFSGSQLQGLSGKDLDLSRYVDRKALADSVSLSRKDLKKIFGALTASITRDKIENLTKQLLKDYAAKEGSRLTVSADEARNVFRDYLKSSGAKKALAAFVQDVVRENAEAAVKDPSSISVSEKKINELAGKLADGFADYAEKKLLPDAQDASESFADYLQSDSARKIMENFAEKQIDTRGMEKEFERQSGRITAQVKQELERQIRGAMKQASAEIAAQIRKEIASAVKQADFAELVSIDSAMLKKAVKLNLTQEELKDLVRSMLSDTTESYEKNLNTLGYARDSDPKSITIYPKDFKNKGKIQSVIQAYNQRMEDSGQEAKVLTYNDLSGTFLSTVTDLVDTVSTALIALVGISLVVSSIMIGVITHISVIERRKEIGILRAIGASRFNISEVFNAETFITGLLAGGIGVGIARLLLFPANYVIHTVIHQPDISARMTPLSAVLLVALSIGLNVASGLLPARRAAKSDPVTALRSE
jgi:putative ABC transport system permease protein